MDRYYQSSITVAAGVQPNAPTTTVVPLENAQLLDIELIVPPGHGGLTGIRIRMSRQQVIPWGLNDWIVSDNYTRTFVVDAEIGINTMSVQTYNTDVFSHSFYVRWHIRERHATTSGLISDTAAPVLGLISDTFPISDAPQEGLVSPGGGVPTLPPPPPPPPIFTLPGA